MENIKRYNKELISFIIFNILAAFVLRDNYSISDIINNDNKNLIGFLVTSPFAIWIIVILNGFIPSQFKYRLAFWKWNNPLPAQHLLKTLSSDERFSVSQVIEKYGPIPNEPKQQNYYWYEKIYKPNQSSVKVIEAHKNFLMTRDLTAICLLLFIPFIIDVLLFSGSWIQLIILFFEYLSLTLVCSFYGKRFVNTTVAESL